LYSSALLPGASLHQGIPHLSFFAVAFAYHIEAWVTFARHHFRWHGPSLAALF
jgi:hypothetical protein